MTDATKAGLVITAHPGDFVWRAGGAIALLVVGHLVLTGGLGADTFVYNTGHGHDIITDFRAARSMIGWNRLSSTFLNASLFHTIVR